MLHIQPSRVLRTLIVINCLLIGGFIFFRHVHLPLRSITRLFDVTAEASVPAWYSAMLLAAIGLVALLRGLALHQAGRSSGWILYLVLGAGFVFLSADEVGQIHETISGGLHKHLDPTANTSKDASAWDMVTFGIYFVAAVLILLSLWRQALDLFLRSPGRWSILAGGVLFATGATAVDQFQSAIPLRLGAALEDGLEVFGSALMLHGFLRNLGTVAITTAPADAVKSALPTMPAAPALIVPAKTASAASIPTRPAPAAMGSTYDEDDVALHGL